MSSDKSAAASIARRAAGQSAWVHEVRKLNETNATPIVSIERETLFIIRGGLAAGVGGGRSEHKTSRIYIPRVSSTNAAAAPHHAAPILYLWALKIINFASSGRQ